jgi:hypothetical protein
LPTFDSRRQGFSFIEMIGATSAGCLEHFNPEYFIRIARLAP